MTLTPSLARAASTLRRYGVTTEDADVVDVLEHIQAVHFAISTGMCRGCAGEDRLSPWPCPRFVYGQNLAVQFIGRAADRTARHAKSVIDRAAPPDEKRKFRVVEESA